MLPGIVWGAEKHLGAIEFFGHEGIDVEAIRKALPFREGDVATLDDAMARWKPDAERVVREITGRDATDVAVVCCDDRGAYMVYIGIAGGSYRAAVFGPAPAGSQRLPSSALRLFERTMAASREAVSRGAAGEDHSRGYTLSTEPASRAIQLEIRKFALANESRLYTVLAGSADAKHRGIAAHFLGYAKQSDRQLAALAAAGSDPDSTTRNNAVRALTVLAFSNPQVAAKIPVERFGWMLASGTWSDRNKSAWLFQACTREPSPAALAALRDARVPLREMARWRSSGHASAAQSLLSRARGKAQYCFGLLVRPENAPPMPDADLRRIQGEHLAHLGKLHESGWLVAAGPMAKAGPIRGFVISQCASLEEAAEKTGADPAVRAGRLTVEQYSWSGPAGVGERYRRMKAADPNSEDKMVICPVVFYRPETKWGSGIPAETMQRHRDYTVSLVGKGLVASGPLRGGPGDRVEVAIFDGIPMAEAAKLVSASPLVAEGWAAIEALEWYAADGTFADRY